MMPPFAIGTTPEGYAAAGFVLTIAVLVLRWTDRHQNDWLDDCQEELTRARRALGNANDRIDWLVDQLIARGVVVPAQVRRRVDPDDLPDDDLETKPAT